MVNVHPDSYRDNNHLKEESSKRTNNTDFYLIYPSPERAVYVSIGQRPMK